MFTERTARRASDLKQSAAPLVFAMAAGQVTELAGQGLETRAEWRKELILLQDETTDHLGGNGRVVGGELGLDGGGQR